MSKITGILISLPCYKYPVREKHEPRNMKHYIVTKDISWCIMYRMCSVQEHQLAGVSGVSLAVSYTPCPVQSSLLEKTSKVFCVLLRNFHQIWHIVLVIYAKQCSIKTVFFTLTCKVMRVSIVTKLIEIIRHC